MYLLENPTFVLCPPLLTANGTSEYFSSDLTTYDKSEAVVGKTAHAGVRSPLVADQ